MLGEGGQGRGRTAGTLGWVAAWGSREGGALALGFMPVGLGEQASGFTAELGAAVLGTSEAQCPRPGDCGGLKTKPRASLGRPVTPPRGRATPLALL